jgi:hypothetical protein
VQRALLLGLEVVPVPLAAPVEELDTPAGGGVVVEPFDAGPAWPRVRLLLAICG